ncbi:superinfection immunity protein [Pseudomonas sp. NPDC089407]|uniref:superinfection immunity protein n=1 Tax=Pseudomonas sp. NPDC089407 TaxID=3364464 RepID=UPI0038504E98
MSQSSSAGLGFILLLLAVLIYFIPTMVAGKRGHPSGTAIFLLNLLAGWTFIGWLVALVWAASAFSQDAAPTAAASPSPAEGDRFQQLAKLADLKERGHLTTEEFEAEKAKILSN